MISVRRLFSVPLPNGRCLNLGERTFVMGILNVTPDSFSDGGLRLDPEVAVADGLRMIEGGADLLDIGGESTRPGAEPVDAAEELRRVLPVIERLRDRTPVPLSIDTYKAEVADRALAAGADIVNDISGLAYEPELGRVAAAHQAALVLMHTRGRSADMYTFAVYEDVVGEVTAELAQAVGRAAAAGVDSERIILDPGVGFAKRAEHSFALLAGLERLAVLGRPILIGPSRKSYLQLAVGRQPPAERQWGSAAAVAAAVLFGAHIVRVHDVAEMVQVARVADAIRAEGL